MEQVHFKICKRSWSSSEKVIKSFKQRNLLYSNNLASTLGLPLLSVVRPREDSTKLFGENVM